jgi:hypothetical protein
LADWRAFGVEVGRLLVALLAKSCVMLVEAEAGVTEVRREFVCGVDGPAEAAAVAGVETEARRVREPVAGVAFLDEG